MKRGDFRAFYGRLADRYLLSVYLDGQADDPAMSGAWRVQLDTAVDRLRAETALRAPRHVDAVERALAVVREALSGVPGRLPMDGLALFASETEVLHREDLPVRLATRVVWRKGPLTEPFLEALLPDGTLFVADVSLDAADLYAWDGARGLSLLTRFELEVTHEAVASVGVMKGVRGTSGFRGASAQDEREQALQEDRRRMFADIVRSLAMRVAGRDLLFLFGSQGATGELARMLPTDLRRAAVVETMEARHGERGLVEAARRALAHTKVWEFDAALQGVADLAHRDGRGAFGLHAVRRAANRGAVAMLLLSRRYARAHPTVAEPLIGATFRAGGTVLEAGDSGGDELDRLGRGVAARLRYPVTT